MASGPRNPTPTVSYSQTSYCNAPARILSIDPAPRECLVLFATVGRASAWELDITSSEACHILCHRYPRIHLNYSILLVKQAALPDAIAGLVSHFNTQAPVDYTRLGPTAMGTDQFAVALVAVDIQEPLLGSDGLVDVLSAS